MSEASKVTLEYMFNSNDNFSLEWCFKTRSSEEGNTYNDKEHAFQHKQNDNQLYNFLEKNYFLFQTGGVIKQSPRMFETQTNKPMNNAITYVAPKNKTMVHSKSLNNRISFVVGISIFGFKTYWKLVFNLIEIKTTPTFKHFLQSETLNAEKNK